MRGGVGEKIAASVLSKAEAPIEVMVSDGTLEYPAIHPLRTYKLPLGTALVDCSEKEYSEFELTTSQELCLEFFRLSVGANAKVYVYNKEVNTPIILSFDKEVYGLTQSFLLQANQKVSVITVEAIRNPEVEDSIRYVVQLEGQRYGSSSIFHTNISIPTLEDFGSFSKGTLPSELNGLTINQILEKRLWKPSAAPTFYAPTLSLLPQGKTVEEGTVLTENFQVSFNQRDGGPTISSAKLYENGSNYSDLPFEVSFQVKGTVSFQAFQNYEKGENTKTTEDGVVWPNTIEAGVVSSSKRYFRGQRAMFFGALSNLPNSSEAIRSLSILIVGKSNQYLTIDAKWENQFLIFAYPKSYGELTFIKYIEGLGANVITTFNKTEIEVTDASLADPIAYNVYTTNSPLLYSNDVHYEFQF